MVETTDGQILKGRLRGKFKQAHEQKGITNPLAVGDNVECEKEHEQEVVSITKIEPRENYIIRKSVHKRGQGHMIAANVDQALLVATLSQPRTSLGFVDRFLVAAESFGIEAVVVLNKLDLLDAQEAEALKATEVLYESLGYRFIFTSALTGAGMEEMKDILNGRITLLSGHSGVGKSSLINTLKPGLDLRTAMISDFANKGVHTTTFAERFPLWDGTYIIDTPGIKELGLVDIDKYELSHFFPEMRAMLGECRFGNCGHTNEPGCKVRDKVESGAIAISRYQSYLSMLADEDSHR